MNTVMKSSRLPVLIMSITSFIAISAFIWLGVHELDSVKEMRHIIQSDLRNIELRLETTEKSTLFQAEIQSHLNKSIQSSHIVFSVICVSIFLSALTWFFVLRYLRRKENIKLNQHKLEEFLYYDQVSDMHASSISEQLPSAIKEMQLDHDIFMTELRRALDNNEFILHYQPIINASTGKITDVEALIRWQHPVHGLLSPAVFLPLCENNGFIIKLGEWVIHTACGQIKKWHDMGYSLLSVSINLSSRQLNHPGLLAFINDTIAQHSISPRFIKLEITESSLMKDIEACVKILKSLRQTGLQLSLDDFGTGYSSLNYIKHFPINNLKIDRSFIRDMATNITSLAIVESVITLAKSMGLTITAEGVENNHQLHMLKKMQCDMIQGYLYSKPVSAAEFTQLLAAETVHGNKDNALLHEYNKYRYDVLKQEHFVQAAEVIAESFCEYEPMTKYLGLSHSEFMPFAKLMVEKAIRDGLSIVALDQDKVSACTIVEDIADPLGINIDIDPRFKIIFSLLENLGGEFFSERKLEKGHIAHLFITAVNKNCHGHGLSRKINFESIKLAKEKGFDFMCCEFTHDYNKKGTVKNLQNSRLLIKSCDYKDFIYNGKKPFENLEGSASAYIWELREGAKLQYHALEY